MITPIAVFVYVLEVVAIVLFTSKWPKVWRVILTLFILLFTAELFQLLVKTD